MGEVEGVGVGDGVGEWACARACRTTKRSKESRHRTTTRLLNFIFSGRTPYEASTHAPRILFRYGENIDSPRSDHKTLCSQEESKEEKVEIKKLGGSKTGKN